MVSYLVNLHVYLDLNLGIAMLNNWVVWKRKFDFKGLNEYLKRGNFIGGLYSHLSGCFCLFAPKFWEGDGDIQRILCHSMNAG